MSRMMMMIGSVVALSASASAAYYFISNNKPVTNQTSSKNGSQSDIMPVTTTMAPVVQNLSSADGRNVSLVSSAPAPMGQTGLDGRYNIKRGPLSLTVDSASCDEKNPWFDESATNDVMRWNVRTVPGYQDVYTIESEDRIFSKGCEAAFLTVTPGCGSVTLEPPGMQDRQYWKFIGDSVKGGYAIQSVHCYNKRMPSYIISSGTQAGQTNQPRFISSPSAIYSLIAAL